MKSLIKIKLVIFCMMLFDVAFSQQDPMYSMYMFNPVAINPAYVGSTEQVQLVGLFRRQWMQFPGSPATVSFTAHGQLKSEKMGLGFSLLNDQVGTLKTTALMGIYSYKVKLKSSMLSFGVQLGVRNLLSNLSEVQLAPENKFDAAFASNISLWNFNFGAGAFWYGKNWFAGLSLPHISNNVLSENQLNTNDIARLKTHVNLQGGYVFELGEDFKLKPSVLIKNVAGAPLQFDINTNVYYQNNYGLGLSYRSGNAILLIFDVKVNKNMKIGYATDFSVNRLSGAVGSSHELMLRYDFQPNKSKGFTEREF